MAECTANDWCDKHPKWKYTGNFEKLNHHDGSIIQVVKQSVEHIQKNVKVEIIEEVKMHDYEKLMVPNIIRFPDSKQIPKPEPLKPPQIQPLPKIKIDCKICFLSYDEKN